MRKAPKFRLLFLAIAIFSYWVCSKMMPETLPSELSWSDWTSPWFVLGNTTWLTLSVISAVFFIVLPILYWICIVKVGKQAAWKIIMIFSLSSLIARYQYPEQIAQYFEFIMYFRYPIMAILLIIELFLMYTVIKSLWNARSLSGDPRVNSIIKYQSKFKDSELSEKEKSKLDKESEISLIFAHEPASWYYAIKRFSKKHVKSIANVQLLSASRWYLLLLNLVFLAVAIISYQVLSGFSEMLALIIASIIVYSAIMFLANYRVSRHYSFYILDNRLVINDSWWGMLVVDVDNICNIESGNFDDATESLKIGRGTANLQLQLTTAESFYTGMGMICDKVDVVNLVVDDPEKALVAINEIKKG